MQLDTRQDYEHKWMARPCQGSLWGWWEVLNERGKQMALVQPSPYPNASDWWPARRTAEMIAQSMSAEWDRRRSLEPGPSKDKPSPGALIIVNLGAPILMVVVGETEESTLLVQIHNSERAFVDGPDEVYELMASSFQRGPYGQDIKEVWYPAGQWEALSWEGKPPKGSRQYAKTQRKKRKR